MSIYIGQRLSNYTLKMGIFYYMKIMTEKVELKRKKTLFAPSEKRRDGVSGGPAQTLERE